MSPAAVKTRPKGLGKGISALIADDDIAPVSVKARAATGEGQGAAAAAATETPTLSIAVLAPGRFQPRRRFDEANLRELADSIARNGVMQPIVVRLNPDAKDKYEIIAGERRWRAAQRAGLDTVPVVIRELTDKQALELALIENIQRQDLTPLEEAEGYQRLCDEFAYTQEELAQAVGKSRSHIANLTRLLALPEAVKTMLDDGSLTMGHARALIGVEDAAALAEAIVMRGLNVRQAERWIQSGKNPGVAGPRGRAAVAARAPQAAPQTIAPTEQDADILALEEALSQNIGLKVSIRGTGESGEILIRYQNLQELDEILRKLGGVV